MTAQKGKDLLLKVDSDGMGSFTTVAGLRARSIAFNAATVDVTDAESAGRWRELLAGAGIKTARLTGSGIFKDATSDETVRGYFFNGTIRDWQVVVPDFGSIEGAFQVTAWPNSFGLKPAANRNCRKRLSCGACSTEGPPTSTGSDFLFHQPHAPGGEGGTALRGGVAFNRVDMCRTLATVCRVCGGELEDPTHGATRYHAHVELPGWARRRQPLALIGRRFFY